MGRNVSRSIPRIRTAENGVRYFEGEWAWRFLNRPGIAEQIRKAAGTAVAESFWRAEFVREADTLHRRKIESMVKSACAMCKNSVEDAMRQDRYGKWCDCAECPVLAALNEAMEAIMWAEESAARRFPEMVVTTRTKTKRTEIRTYSYRNGTAKTVVRVSEETRTVVKETVGRTKSGKQFRIGVMKFD